MHTVFRLDSSLYTTVYTSDANKIRKGITMNTPDDRDAETSNLKTAHLNDDMLLKDADDNNGGLLLMMHCKQPIQQKQQG